MVAISPGTGAQFAILPPQNASGNWVKVVQRVPVRVQLDRDPMASKLRAGMSAYVEIDTGASALAAPPFGSPAVAGEHEVISLASPPACRRRCAARW